MLYSCVFPSFAAVSIVGVGAFHVPVLPSARTLGEARAAAGNGHVSRMSAADGKAKSFYPFQRSNAPPTRCVVYAPSWHLCHPPEGCRVTGVACENKRNMCRHLSTKHTAVPRLHAAPAWYQVADLL